MNTPKATLIFKHLPKEICLHIDRFRKHPIVDCIKSHEFVRKWREMKLRNLVFKYAKKLDAVLEKSGFCECSYTKGDPIFWSDYTYWEHCRGFRGWDALYVVRRVGGVGRECWWDGWDDFMRGIEGEKYICNKCRGMCVWKILRHMESIE